MSEALGLSSAFSSNIPGLRILGIIGRKISNSPQTVSLSAFSGWNIGQVVTYTEKSSQNNYNLYSPTYFTPSMTELYIPILENDSGTKVVNVLTNISSSSITIGSVANANGSIVLVFYSTN